MEAFAREPVAEAVNTAIHATDMVVAVNLTEVNDFSDLPVEEQGQQRRNAMLRPICEDAVSASWHDIRPLLEPMGGYAGNSNFAHGIICELVYRCERDRFDSIGDVTLAELWPLCHSIFKKRKLVFERGFVVGQRISA